MGNSILIFCWMVLWSKQNSSSSLYKGNPNQYFPKLVGEPISAMKRIIKKLILIINCGISLGIQNLKHNIDVEVCI